jgi:hypothetical protein
VTIALLLATVGALLWKAWRDRSPYRARALLVFFTGALCLVAAFGTGRTGAEFVNRYFALATPLSCAAFLSWSFCFGPTLGHWLQLCLLAAAAALMPLNATVGLRYAHDYHRRMEAFRADLLAARSPGELVARHGANLCPAAWRLHHFVSAGIQMRRSPGLWNQSGFPTTEIVSFHEWLAMDLRRLHDAGIGDYAQMRVDDPPLREIAPSPATSFAISRAPGVDHNSLEEAAILLTPEQPIYVAGVRVRRPLQSPYVRAEKMRGLGSTREPWVQVFWRSPGQSDYLAPNRYVFLWTQGKDEQIVWIFANVEQIALHFAEREVQRRIGSGNLPVTILVPIDGSRSSADPAEASLSGR